MSGNSKQILRAKLAEQAERYEDMTKAMKIVAESSTEELTVEERNLLSVAYRNVIGARRASYRILNQIEKSQKDSASTAQDIQEYKTVVEQELNDICKEAINLISAHLIPNSKSTEPKVFFHKMEADYWRYLAEIDGKEKTDQQKNAQDSYLKAVELASNEMSPTNPIRLGLMLNYSVFQYEVAGLPKEAMETARKAFDSAIEELDNLSEESYKDSTLIMQLLRDNLTLWKSESSDTNDEELDE